MMTPEIKNIPVGGKIGLRAGFVLGTGQLGTPQGPVTVTWNSSNPRVVKVAGSGIENIGQGVAQGVAVIHAIEDFSDGRRQVSDPIIIVVGDPNQVAWLTATTFVVP